MRRRILFILIISFLFIQIAPYYNSQESDLIVYKTPAGAKYHRYSCRYVKGKAIEIELSKAINYGLKPCKVCHPPTEDDRDRLN